MAAHLEEYARQVLKAGQDLGVTPRGIVIGFATVFVESGWTMYSNQADPPSLNFPHEALSYDANSVGLFQQRAEWWGTVADRMDPYRSAVLFFNRLKSFDYNNTGRSPGSYAQSVQGSAFPDRYDKHIGEAQELYDRLVVPVVKKEVMEKVLSYPRSSVGEYDGVAQQKSWDCGPATAQIILAAAGVQRSEEWLIQQIGTTVNGTNSAEYIAPVLNRLLAGSGYKSVWISREPVTKAQVEQLWKDIVRSIDAGRGVVLNFEAPPNNYPRGTRGSVSPAYGGGNTIYHYTAGMGYAVDADGSRHIWVADPGFRPFGYWCSLEQVATLIVPHAYAYAADAPAVVTKPPVSPSVPAPAPSIPTVPSSDGSLARLWLEWNAVEFGDQEAIGQIVSAAKAGESRSKATLAVIERVNPAALQTYIQSKGK
jgi:putative lipoic acid-binding regulatory protein